MECAKMQTTMEKTEKKIIDAQKRVMELAESIYALIKDGTLEVGFAKDALHVALILKRRQDRLYRFNRSFFQSQREIAQVPLKSV
jgi:uncharacterized protein YeeX (DUF496 family)